MNAVILAAGRATRLGGRCKLLIEAGGMRVHEWHQRALDGWTTTAVIRPDDYAEVAYTATWLSALITHPLADGPVGALYAYLKQRPDEDGPLMVLFGDTLLPSVPLDTGDWVGIAKAPSRVWDYWDGDWMRGVPWVQVCIGLYRFECRSCLVKAARELVERAGGEEVHMVSLLRAYDNEHFIQPLRVDGWQDAGDPEAVSKVEPIGA